MTNGDYCVPGNAVPNVKMTSGTPFPGVPAGNDPWRTTIWWIKRTRRGRTYQKESWSTQIRQSPLVRQVHGCSQRWRGTCTSCQAWGHWRCVKYRTRCQQPSAMPHCLLHTSQPHSLRPTHPMSLYYFNLPHVSATVQARCYFLPVWSHCVNARWNWAHILETSLENLRKTSYLRKIIGKYLSKH